jgi:hypothetical protein
VNLAFNDKIALQMVEWAADVQWYVHCLPHPTIALLDYQSVFKFFLYDY